MRTLNSIPDRLRDAAAVIEALGDSVIVLGTIGRITYANEQARERLHRTLAELQALDPLALVHPDDLGLAAEALGDAVHRPGVHAQIELRIDDGVGGWLDVELVGSVMAPDATGGPGAVILSARPTGWRNAARAALESIGTGAPLGEIVPLIARTAREVLSAEGVRIRWDDVEATAGRLDRSGWTVGLHPELPVTGEIDFGAATDRPWQADHRSLDEIRRLVAVVSRRETRLQRLRFDATHDPLTGMNNRRAVQEALTGLAGSGGVALLFVDLDNFKLINDTYGYERGDGVLREAANRLHEVVGGVGLVGRFGGDEFVVLRRCDAAGGEAMADDIVAAFRRPLTADDPPLIVTVSVGVVHCPGPPCADRSDELLRDAGTAAHRAKVAGRDRWVRFSPRLHEIAAARLDRSQLLRTAIREERFDMHFQPEVDLASGRVVGFEALVRWDDGHGGTLLPGAFLGLAADLGLLAHLSRSTIARSCRWLQSWRSARPDAAGWYVSVNVSPEELSDPGLVHLVDLAIAEAGLAPGDLRLEVVERGFGSGSPSVERLNELHERGVCLVMDEFGTEASSLARLRDAPIHALKIDRSVVHGAAADPVAQAIVDAVARMGAALGIVVGAVGIEDIADRDTVIGLGCATGQGSLFGAPVPGRSVGRFSA